jgi:GT2 family glycosyltransferase
MDLSIIIVSFNTRGLLKKCLEAIVESCRVSEFQSCRVEVIVVDNGSEDGSAEEIQNLKFKIILNKTNLGFAKAVNQALKIAQGKAVLLLNSDTQVKEETLVKLVEFEKKIGPAIIGARFLNPDGSAQASVFHFPTIKRAIWEFWLGKKDTFSKYIPAGKEPVEVEAVSGGAMLISREIIEKIGPLDERYFMYFEDMDYCRRAKLGGFKVYYLPSAKVIHEHGASGRQVTDEANQWRRLIPSSKIYHGTLRHHLMNFILWTGQKCQKLIVCINGLARR